MIQFKLALVLSIWSLAACCCSASPCSLFGHCEPTRSFYKIKRTDVISPKELANRLSRDLINRIHGRGYKHLYDETIDLLAMTSQKQEPRTVLGLFSVDQLLSLNEIRESDCESDAELNRRNEICEELSRDGNPKCRSFQFNLNLHEIAQCNNLRRYCVELLDRFKSTCRRDRATKAFRLMSSGDRKRLTVFQRAIYRAYSKNKSSMSLDPLIDQLLETMETSEQLKLKGSCQRFVEAVRDSFEDDPEYGASRLLFYDAQKQCRRILSSRVFQTGE